MSVVVNSQSNKNKQPAKIVSNGYQNHTNSYYVLDNKDIATEDIFDTDVLFCFRNSSSDYTVRRFLICNKKSGDIKYDSGSVSATFSKAFASIMTDRTLIGYGTPLPGTYSGATLPMSISFEKMIYSEGEYQSTVTEVVSFNCALPTTPSTTPSVNAQIIGVYQNDFYIVLCGYVKRSDNYFQGFTRIYVTSYDPVNKTFTSVEQIASRNSGKSSKKSTTVYPGVSNCVKAALYNGCFYGCTSEYNNSDTLYYYPYKIDVQNKTAYIGSGTNSPNYFSQTYYEVSVSDTCINGQKARFRSYSGLETYTEMTVNVTTNTTSVGDVPYIIMAMNTSCVGLKIAPAYIGFSYDTNISKWLMFGNNVIMNRYINNIEVDPAIMIEDFAKDYFIDVVEL